MTILKYIGQILTVLALLFKFNFIYYFILCVCVCVFWHSNVKMYIQQRRKLSSVGHVLAESHRFWVIFSFRFNWKINSCIVMEYQVIFLLCLYNMGIIIVISISTTSTNWLLNCGLAHTCSGNVWHTYGPRAQFGYIWNVILVCTHYL